MLATLVAGSAALFGAGAWIFARAVLDANDGQLTLWVTVASGAGAILGSAFAAPLFGAALDKLLEPSEPGAPSPELLERWCTRLRVAVLQRRVRGARSQREQMLRGGVLIDQLASPELAVRAGPTGRPHVRIEGAPQPWSKLVEGWSAAEGRMVIIGDPGYGKTFAGLTLVAHINHRGSDVAEIFPLVDWHAWSAGRDDPSIDTWLVAQLTQSYPELTNSAAEAIVMQGRLVPVFDGLDEVPEAARPDCRDALEAYAGREPPFQSFVVTCRQREYFALAPKWVGAERHVALVGLDAERIATVLTASVGPSPEWAAVIAAIERGDDDLVALLRSPLRLVAAIEAYQRRDPRELLRLAAQDDAREHLWDLLLGAHPRTFADASAEEVRRWLSFLAASLQSHNRQRFWMHELYLYASAADRRWFWRLACVLYVVLAGAFPFFAGSISGKILAGLSVITAVIAYRRLKDEPMRHIARAPVTRRHYVKALPETALVGLLAFGATVVLAGPILLAVYTLSRLLAGLPVHVDTSALQALQVAALTGVVVGPATAAGVIADVGTSGVSEEPPARFAGRGPDAVINATRDQGLIVAFLTAALMSIPLALLGLDSVALWAFVLGLALLYGLLNGLGAWLYFHWTRWRLARSGLLPLRLRSFLDWASDDTGWLRASGAYEFRHKELLDYLARETRPVGAGNLSWAEAGARHDKRGVSRAEARRGDRLMRAQDYDRALKAYTAAAKAAPDDARIHRARSHAFEKLGRHAEQLEAASAAAGLVPLDPANHTALCVASARLGNMGAALEHARRAAELGPDQVQHQVNQAIAFATLGQNDEAMRVLDAALVSQPGNARLQSLRAAALDGLQRHRKQLEAARQKARLDADDVNALWRLAVAERQMGHRAEAKRARERAVAVSLEQGAVADGAATRAALLWTLNSRGFSSEALSVAERTLTDTPEQGSACLANLAHTYFDLGRFAEANQYLDAAEAAIRTPMDHNLLANALLAGGRYGEAARRVGEAVRGERDTVVFAFTRAEVSLARADLEALHRDLSSALRRATRTTSPYGDAAWLCRLLWRCVPPASHDLIIDRLVESFASHGVIAGLAGGLVEGTPTSPDQTGWDEARLAGWCDAWNRHAGLQPAVQVLLTLAEQHH